MEDNFYDLMRQVTLGELIERVQQEPLQKIISIGIRNPHSNRGYYDEVGFEIVEDISIENMLHEIESAMHGTFTGWKGGEFSYDKSTLVHLSEPGGGGGQLTLFILNKMLANEFHDQ